MAEQTVLSSVSLRAEKMVFSMADWRVLVSVAYLVGYLAAKMAASRAAQRVWRKAGWLAAK